jgi:hypothetical protein
MSAIESVGSTSFMLLVRQIGGSGFLPDGELVVSSDGGFTYDVSVRPENNYMTNFDTLELTGGVLFLGSSSTVESGTGTTAAGTGLWRSFDEGETWDSVSDDFSIVGYGPTGDLYDAVLAIHGYQGQAEDTELFVSVAQEGVFHSTDAGDHFEHLELPSGELGAPLSIDRFASSVKSVFASSGTDADVLLRWRSSNQAWAPASGGLPSGFVVLSLLAHGGVVFAGIDAADGGAGLYFSVDDGDSWQKTGLDRAVVSLLVRDDTLFAGVRDGGLQSLDLGPCE